MCRHGRVSADGRDKREAGGVYRTRDTQLDRVSRTAWLRASRRGRPLLTAAQVLECVTAHNLSRITKGSIGALEPLGCAYDGGGLTTGIRVPE